MDQTFPASAGFDSRRARAVFFAAVLGVVFLAAHALGDDAAELKAAMDRMAGAVLAGDKGAYLAGVDDADPIFRKEQENWAADFDHHKVDSFSVSWAGDGPSINDDQATGELKMEWRVAGEGRRTGEVSFPARFVRRDGSWRYAGEEWHEIGAPGLRICFAKGLEEVAARVAGVLPEIRAHVHEGFELTVDREVVVKLYASMAHLQQSIYLSYDDGLSGWNEPHESVKILPGRRASLRQLRPLLAHEYGHVCTFELGPEANDMAWWILEGVAELSAESYQGGGPDRMVRRWAASDTLADWSRLADFRNCAPEDQIFVYNQGHHMIAYISERFGRQARNAWMREMAAGVTLDDATVKVLGLGFGTLDQEWRRSLKEKVAAEAVKEEPAPAGR